MLRVMEAYCGGAEEILGVGLPCKGHGTEEVLPSKQKPCFAYSAARRQSISFINEVVDDLVKKLRRKSLHFFISTRVPKCE
jgi:hypothetical protein